MRSQRSLNRNVILITAITGIALIVRIIFSVGVVRVDDVAYAEHAYNLISGQFGIGDLDLYGMRYSVFVPVAILFRLFGVHDYAVLWWPLFCSLAGIILIYALGVHFFRSQAIGLLSALFLSLYPPDILFATQLLPDIVVSLFAGISVFLFFRANGSKWRTILAGIALAIAFFARDFFAVSVVLFYIFYVILKREYLKPALVTLTTFAIFPIIESIILFLYSGDVLLRLHVTFAAGGEISPDFVSNLNDFLEQFFTNRLFSSYYWPIFISIIVMILARQIEFIPLLTWLFSGSLVLAITYMSVNFSTFAYESRFPLLLKFPSLLILAGAIGLTISEFQWSTDKFVGIIISLMFLVQVLGLGLLKSGHEEFLMFWQIPILFLVGFFALFFARIVGYQGISQLLIFLAIPLIGWNSIYPVYSRAKEFRGWNSEYEAAFNFLKGQSVHPIYVMDEIWARKLNYYFGYQYDFNSYAPQSETKSGKIHIVRPIEEIEPEEAAYIVVDRSLLNGSGSDDIPDNWWLQQRSNYSEIYRAMPEPEAIRESGKWEAKAREGDNSSSTLLNLGGAYLNARMWSEAISTFQTALELDPSLSSAQWGLLHSWQKLLEQSSETALGSNLITNPGFEMGTENWSILNPTGQAKYEIGETYSREGHSLHIQSRNAGYHGGVYQIVGLDFGSVYLFSAHVKVENIENLQARILYWQYTDQAGNPQGRSSGEFKNVSADWAYVQALIALPVLASSSEVSFYPILVNNEGDVWIDDVKLVRLIES